jgi:hypothetical protein
MYQLSNGSPHRYIPSLSDAPITLRTLETNVLEAEDVYALSPSDCLCHVVDDTKNPDVARKLLADVDKLKKMLFDRYHIQNVDPKIDDIRKKNIERSIQRLQKLIRPPLIDRTVEALRNFFGKNRILKVLEEGNKEGSDADVK